MTIEIPRTKYHGRIREITLGQGENAVTLGGETSYPFYLFEGEMPHRPRVALEIQDAPPDDWAPAVRAPFTGVTGDPVAWAKKCRKEYGAEMLCLALVSTDPNGANRHAREAAQVVKRVAEAVDVPLIVWGTANHEKDAEVLTLVAEVCRGKRLILGPVEEANHKAIGAAAVANGHTIAASSPIDINLAKQLNILLGNAGVPDELIIMDPTVSSIGYGIEYCYSVMERMRGAALTQQDEKLQFPIIANLGREAWKTREANAPTDSALGDAEKRGILLEAMSATMMLLAGADLLVVRHPKSARLVQEMIADLSGEAD